MTSTLPVTFETHWTVTVPVPLATTLAMVWMEGLATEKLPEYGLLNVTGPLRGGRLNWPVAIKVTLPFGELTASAVVGVTVMAVSTRPELGLTELQEMSGSASSAIRKRTGDGRRRICITNP